MISLSRWLAATSRLTLPLILAAALAACSSTSTVDVGPQAAVVMPQAPAPGDPTSQPQIVETSGGNLQCVAYARSIGEVQIFGDAWTWWDQAAGSYERGQAPRVGAVLVLGRKGASLGHVAVIRQVVNSRLVIAEHANWLNRHEIELNSPIMDVSPANDWSAVRVWYVPAKSWGVSVYPAYGFIYPTRMAAL